MGVLLKARPPDLLSDDYFDLVICRRDGAGVEWVGQNVDQFYVVAQNCGVIRRPGGAFGAYAEGIGDACLSQCKMKQGVGATGPNTIDIQGTTAVGKNGVEGYFKIAGLDGGVLLVSDFNCVAQVSREWIGLLFRFFTIGQEAAKEQD